MVPFLGRTGSGIQVGLGWVGIKISVAIRGQFLDLLDFWVSQLSPRSLKGSFVLCTYGVSVSALDASLNFEFRQVSGYLKNENMLLQVEL